MLLAGPERFALVRRETWSAVVDNRKSAGYVPEKSPSHLLGLIKTANRFDDKKNTCEFTDGQFSALLDVVSERGGRGVLEAMIDEYACNRTCLYYVDRMTQEPHSRSTIRSETQKDERAVAVFHWIEELLRRLGEKPDRTSIERINHQYEIRLTAEDYTSIGDDSRDQTHWIQGYTSRFAEILKERNWS